MASLLGKADPTLVSGALTYAKANIPGDMSGIYETRKATQKKWMDFAQEVQTAWDNKDVEWNKDLAKGTEGGRTAISELILGKQNTAGVNVSTNAIIDLNNQYKSFKNNRDQFKETKIAAELTKFATTIKFSREKFASMASISGEGGFIIKGTGKETKLWNMILEDYNNDTDNSNQQYKDGDIVYTYEGLSMTMTELENKLVEFDSRPGISVQKELTNVLKTSVETNRPGDDQFKSDVKGRIKKHMKKRSDRFNIMHEEFEGLPFTFFEALTGKDKGLQEQIYDILENLSGIGLDLNKDGIKDSEVDELDVQNFDYTTADNAILLQEAILDSPYSIEIISGFLVDNIFDKTYNRGQNEKIANERKSRSSSGRGRGSGRTKTPKTSTIKRSKVPYTDTTGRKAEIWSTDIQNLSSQLVAMAKVKSGTKIANIGLGQYTYVKGKGYARASKRADGKIVFDRDSKTKIPIGGYFPTIDDVFIDQGIPLGYSGGSQSTGGNPKITW